VSHVTQGLQVSFKVLNAIIDRNSTAGEQKLKLYSPHAGQIAGFAKRECLFLVEEDGNFL
jgi:hypothetical protein